MNLNDIIRLASYIIGVIKSDTSLTQERISDALHLASLKHFKRKLGLPEEYKPGMPLPAEAFEITKLNTEDIRPFKVIMGWDDSEKLKVDSNGFSEYPKDYYYPSVLSYFYKYEDDVYEREITPLSDLEFQGAVGSLNEKPDYLFPVCNMQAKKIRFAPKDLEAVNMVYLRLPTKPIYVVKNTNGYPEYDPDKSVDFEWNDVNRVDILILMLQDMGLDIKRADIFNYAEQIKERGI